MNADNVPQSRSGNRALWWAALAVLGAFLPVLALTRPLDRIAIVLWLASMPLCILGCFMLAKEIAARRASRQDLD